MCGEGITSCGSERRLLRDLRWLDLYLAAETGRPATTCQLYLSDQARRRYHPPPPHPLSLDTTQYLLIKSGLIYKVSRCPAAQADKGDIFACVFTRNDVCLRPSLSVWPYGLPDR